MSHKVKIHLTAADEGTEIMLVDAFLGRIRSETGELRTTVAPGMYKAHFISGGTMHDVLLDATRPGQDVVHHQEALDLHSAAPLPMSKSGASVQRTTDVGVQMALAEAMSNDVHLHLGSGSHLFLLVRDETTPGPLACLDAVEVLAMDGTRLAKLRDGRHEPTEATAGLSLSLDPGTYRLRVDGGEVGTYEWCVSTVPGMQTQVFLRVERFPSASGDVWSPALRSASLLMVQGMGFQPHRPDMRLTELALQALLRGRQVLPERIIPKLLHYELQNPMLGLLAAHMFLVQEKGRSKHRRMLGEILNYLLHVMPQQPDVLVLQHMLAGSRAKGLPMLLHPPLLRSSWDFVTELSGKGVQMIEPGSPLQRLAPYVIGSRPWLLFAQSAETPITKSSTPHSVAQSIQMLRKMMAKDPERWKVLTERAQSSGQLNNLQMGLMRNLGSVSYLRKVLTGSNTMSMPDTTDRAKELFESINAPRSVKAMAIQDLDSMLKENGE